MLVKLLLLTLATKYVFCGNVLYLSGVASPSHHIWNRALALGLADKGHNVTMIGPDEDKTPRAPNKNFTHILMEDVYEELHDDFDYNAMISLSTFELVQMFQDWSIFQCSKFYKSLGLKRLWNYPKDFKFDVIVVDISAGPCLFSVIERFRFPPTVGVTPFLLPPYVSYTYGNHLHPSFIPWYNLPYGHEMSFTQRIWNWFFTVYDIYMKQTKEKYKYDEMAKETFGGLKADWKQLEKHITIILSNTDPILDVPQPLTPNIIPVGGLHTRATKHLPKDIKDLLDNAKNGVIVFSLGTNFRSDKLPEAKQRALLEAFSKRKELVIWKFESDIRNLPKNVVVRKFLPQNDILGHPNVKLFIGHGGALSTQEAIYHGVPMIAAPFVFDQMLNAKSVEKRKFGIIMEIERIATDYVSSKLTEALENPLYRNTMKAASQRFRDQPTTPLERGIFWVEYAAKHNGAGFMNSPARNMSWIESSNADVFAFLSLIVIGIVLIIAKSCQAVLSRKNKVKTH